MMKTLFFIGILLTPIVSIITNKVIIKREKKEEKTRIPIIAIITMWILIAYTWILVLQRNNMLLVWITIMLTGIGIYILGDNKLDMFYLLGILLSIILGLHITILAYILLVFLMVHLYTLNNLINNKKINHVYIVIILGFLLGLI